MLPTHYIFQLLPSPRSIQARDIQQCVSKNWDAIIFWYGSPLRLFAKVQKLGQVTRGHFLECPCEESPLWKGVRRKVLCTFGYGIDSFVYFSSCAQKCPERRWWGKGLLIYQQASLTAQQPRMQSEGRRHRPHSYNL